MGGVILCVGNTTNHLNSQRKSPELLSVFLKCIHEKCLYPHLISLAFNIIAVTSQFKLPFRAYVLCFRTLLLNKRLCGGLCSDFKTFERKAKELAKW